MLALGERLAARGHEVTFETWQRWREHVQAAGLRFVPAPEYPVFPTRERPLKPYEAVVGRHGADAPQPRRSAAPMWSCTTSSRWLRPWLPSSRACR